MGNRVPIWDSDTISHPVSKCKGVEDFACIVSSVCLVLRYCVTLAVRSGILPAGFQGGNFSPSFT